jgi:dihydrofolate reductase
MIKLIVAIDSYNGIANESGIPWDLPSDSKYYKDKVSTGTIVMGYGTYRKHDKPLHDNPEYVLTSHVEPLRSGFIPIDDIDTFLAKRRNVWVLGGSGVFEAAIKYADRLYITQVDGNFNCTKFFPSFGHEFELIEKSKIHKENGTLFQYQVWQRKGLAGFNESQDV